MSSDLIRIARDGKTIGEYALADLGRAIKAKTVLATDYYWRSGMTGWERVELIAAEAAIQPQGAPAPRKQKPWAVLVVVAISLIAILFAVSSLTWGDSHKAASSVSAVAPARVVVRPLSVSPAMAAEIFRGKKNLVPLETDKSAAVKINAVRLTYVPFARVGRVVSDSLQSIGGGGVAYAGSYETPKGFSGMAGLKVEIEVQNESGQLMNDPLLEIAIVSEGRKSDPAKVIEYQQFKLLPKSIVTYEGRINFFGGNSSQEQACHQFDKITIRMFEGKQQLTLSPNIWVYPSEQKPTQPAK